MKRRLSSTILVALHLVTPIASAQSKDLPSEVDLPTLIDLAKAEKSPRVRVIRENARAARAGIVEASVHPNPTLTYQFTAPLRGTNTTNGSQHFVFIEQPILVAGQIGARKRAAERRVEAADARAEADLIALVAEARHQYIDLLLAQENAKIHQDSLDTLARIRNIVSGRSQLGGASSYDALRLDVADSALSTEVDRRKANVTDMGRRLGALLGYPGWSPTARGRLEPLGIRASVERAGSEAERSNPELRAAEREVAATRSELDAARRNAWPVPAIGAGLLTTTEPRSLAGVIGVSLPLSLFDRAQGQRARAAAQSNIASAEQVASKTEVRAQAERAAALLAAKRESLQRLDRSAISRLPTLETMAESAYREGATNVIALVDANQARRDLLMARAALAAEVMHAEVDLLVATGALLPRSQ